MLARNQDPSEMSGGLDSAKGAKEMLNLTFTRNLLGFLAVFCQVNNREYNEIELFKKRSEKRETLTSKSADQPARRDHTTTCGGAPLWCKLTVCYYIYLNVKLCCLVYWQFQYDYEHMKLEQIDAKLAHLNATDGGDRAASEHLEYLSRLHSRREFHLTSSHKSRAWLAYLGQPMAELHWTFAGALCICVWLTFVVYFFYPVCTSLGLVARLDFYFIRIVQSEQYEALKCRRLVRACARRHTDSSRNFVLNEVSRAEESAENVGSRQARGDDSTTLVRLINSKPGRRLNSAGLSYAQWRNHLLAADHLTVLVREGKLMPINRSSAWVNKMSRQFARLSTTNFIYSFAFDSAILYLFPFYLNYLHLNSVADLLTYLELWALTEISVLATTLWVMLLNVTITDQIRYIVWLQRRVSECIELNDGLMRAERFRGANLATINKNLTRALLEYEIFLAQFRPVQVNFSLITRWAAVAAVSGPMLCRLQMTYVQGGHRSLGIYYCATVVAFVDSLIIPLTRINTCSKILYARMMSLLGQAVKFETISRNNIRDNARYVSPCTTIDRHLIWQLRNILTDSTRFTQQFAASVLPRLPLTVTNLIRLHYWYVLLIISYYCNFQSWKTLLGDRQDDPWNVLGDI